MDRHGADRVDKKKEEEGGVRREEKPEDRWNATSRRSSGRNRGIDRKRRGDRS